DATDNRDVHFEWKRITRLPRRIDTYRATVNRTGSGEKLLGEDHVTGGIEASKDAPLEVFVIVQPHVRTHGHDKLHFRLRRDDLLQDGARVVTNRDNEKPSVQHLPVLDARIEPSKVRWSGR